MYVYHIIISSTSYIFAEHHKLLSNVCHVRHSISICGKSLPHTDYKSPAVGPPDHTTPAVVTYRIQCYNSVNKYNCYCPVTAASRRWRERRVRWGCPCGAGCTLTAFHRLYSIDYLRNDIMKRTILCNCWQKVGWQRLVSCYWMSFALFWSSKFVCLVCMFVCLYVCMFSRQSVIITPSCNNTPGYYILALLPLLYYGIQTTPSPNTTSLLCCLVYHGPTF